VVVVECFKCGEKGHKYRKCSLWEKKGKEVARPREGKVHQEERRPVRPVRKKAQEGEKRLRRVEKGKAACPREGEVQQGWKRSLMEELRKKAKMHYEKGVPREAQLLELGWITKEVVVLYLTCKCGEKRSHVKDNQGQEVIPF